MRLSTTLVALAAELAFPYKHDNEADCRPGNRGTGWVGIRQTRSACATCPRGHTAGTSGCGPANRSPNRRVTYRSGSRGRLQQAFTRALWGYFWGYQSVLRRPIPI